MDKSVRVLIIDDSSSFIELLELRLVEILGKVNFHVAGTIAGGSELYSSGILPDLVVIDQHLPDGLGTDLIKTGLFKNSAVLSMSSDQTEELAAKSIGAGATFFLNKQDLSRPLFKPLIQGLIQRNRLALDLSLAEQQITQLDTVKTMVATLRHEINNPLAAIFGAIFILKKKFSAKPEEMKAIKILDESTQRIKEILEQLDATELVEIADKANIKVFNIPGDPDWKK